MHDPTRSHATLDATLADVRTVFVFGVPLPIASPLVKITSSTLPSGGPTHTQSKEL
jgi:hypothetical protein